MHHRTVSTINTNMCDGSPCIISFCKKYEISCLCFRCGYRSTLVINALCGGSWQVMYAAVCKYPAYKYGTVKTCRSCAAKSLWHSQIPVCFPHKRLHRCIVIGLRWYHIAGSSSGAARCFPINSLFSCFKIK